MKPHDPARPLRGAMIGTGSIAIHHMLGWRAVPGVVIVALANRTRDKAVSLGHQFGVPERNVYADYPEMLEREELDFVDVATAPHLHREAVLAAAERGVHVLCQKPFAGSFAEGREMVAACDAAGVRCVVNENWRWRPWYREVKRLAANGTVGKATLASFRWRGGEVLPTADGGTPMMLARQPYMPELPQLILYEWGIHLIDVLRMLFGPVRTVSAGMGRRSPLVQGEDWAVALFGFDGEAAGLVDVSWSTPVQEDRKLTRGCVDPFLLEGDAGTIELDPYRDDALILTRPGGRQELTPARGRRSRAEAYQDSYAAAQGHFVHSLRTGQSAETEASDNLNTLGAAFAAYAAADRGQTVEVPS